MPGGRPRLYKTAEEKKAANRAKNRKFYDINKAELNEAKCRKRREGREVKKPPKPGTTRTSNISRDKPRQPLPPKLRSQQAAAKTVSLASAGDARPGRSTISAKPPITSTFELLNKERVSGAWERLAEAVDSKPLVEYLTWICETFAERQHADLEAAGRLFSDEEAKLNRLHELIVKYETEAYKLEGCGKCWKEWQTLRVKVEGYRRELCEIECEALVGPGQLVVDFRRKALSFQRPSFSG